MATDFKRGRAFYTYTCPNLSFSLNRPYTTREFAQLCDAIRIKTDYTFVVRPDPITEGGIKFIDWPGKTESMYKTIRFHLAKGVARWPWINETTYDKWKDPAIPAENIFIPDEDEHTCKYLNMQPPSRKKTNVPEIRFSFCLKAFHGAPCFTPSEIMIVARCLKDQGFVQHGRIPSMSALMTPGRI